MELTLDKLLQFDLVGDAENALFDGRASSKLQDFMRLQGDILNTNRFICDCPSYPGSTDKIIRDEMVSAIGSTLAIEGRVLDPRETEESFSKAGRDEVLSRGELEAENSRKVYAFVVELVKSGGSQFKYEETQIKHIHKLFTDGLNYLGNAPGNYRGEIETTFGNPRRPGLCRNNSEVADAMTEFVCWLNRPGEGFLGCNAVVKAIMAHYYLTEIHPFADGNGRTARAVEALVLYQSNLNEYCFWSLANFWSLNRSEYISSLGRIRNTCDAWDFIVWGMTGYLQEIIRIKGLVLRKLKQLMLTDYTKYLLDSKETQEVKINQRILSIIRLLIRIGRTRMDKFYLLPEVSMFYASVSAMTRNRDFKKMKQVGLIRVTGEGANRFIEPNFERLEGLVYNP